MASGQPGHRSESGPSYRLIFTGFRVALDLKKLLLAGAGILLTALGWWILSAAFHSPTVPLWKDYEGQPAAWKNFKRDRARWNLLHHLAGSPNDRVAVDAADVAVDENQFKELGSVAEGRKQLVVNAAKMELAFENQVVAFKTAHEADIEALKKIGSASVESIVVGDEKEQTIRIAGIDLKIEKSDHFVNLKNAHKDAKPYSSLSPANKEIFDKHLAKPAIKPSGKFRVCPWNEERGENPYLLVSRGIHGHELPFGRGGFVGWLLHDQLPVLLEPLLKFISPVFYLFQPEAGGFRNFTYLALVILWNLAVWGFFGGAITRLAAVQIARNEKAPLGETLAFVKKRWLHFFLGPIFPLGILAFLTLGLALFGLVEGWTYYFGDIVVAGLLWPIVILVGLVMAVMLVGLLGWPLMYPTISAEGSDSFDALSRSYSYFYQAPWQYLGNAIVAILYGAALVFFVGFMGSLLVYLGHWGVSRAPGLTSEDAGRDRSPVYLFQHAPTSFGWRDLFLKGNDDWTEAIPAPEGGRVHYKLKDEYVKQISGVNHFGAWLVGIWISLLFLLILGFGYSYFWTASTILYFLLRKHVDDTDIDEVYLDEENLPPPPPKEAPPAPPAAKPGVVSLNVVEPPKA